MASEQVSREPTDKQFAFARAVVKLAREFGMNRLVFEFNASGSADWQNRDDRWHAPTVKMSWSEGRHGSRDSIHLSYQKTAVIAEDGGDAGTQGGGLDQ